MDPIVKVSNLSYRYDQLSGEDIISSISFTVNRGEYLTIIGKNGSGKSTLAQLLVGLLKPDAGGICYNGIQLTEETKWDILKHTGIIFQNPDNQFIGTTVADDIAFSLENINMPYEEMKERVDRALHITKLDQYRESDPSRLSGGQKQRVALAGILALQPEVIILDEAFIMLDPKGKNELLQTLHQLKNEYNLSIISITHDMKEIQLADRVIEMENGKITHSGSPRQIFSERKNTNVPFSERLRRTLQDKGRLVPQTFMSDKEMVEWLCKLN